MDSRQAEQVFHEADALFRQGQYAQALQRLEFLAQQYPNEPNVLYPRALALTQLGRYPEALELCERLIHQHHFEKAQQLKDEIRTRQISQQKPPPSKSFNTPPEIPAVGAPGMPQVNIDDLLNQPPAYARSGAAAPAQRTSLSAAGLSWPLLILLAVVAVTALGALVGLVAGMASWLTAIAFAVGFLFNVVVTWVALRVLGHLSGDTDEDIKNILIAVGVLAVSQLVPTVGGVIGTIAYFYLLSRYFSLSCGALVLFAIISMVLNIAMVILIMMMFGTAILGILGLGSYANG